MNARPHSLLAALILVGPLAFATVAGQGVEVRPDAGGSSLAGAIEAPLEAVALQGWIARAQDNVCGLRDARQLSNPVTVDFRGLMEETEEMKRLRRDRIDPNTPQGIQLRDAARSKVAAACELVMTEQGYCSVWTAIRHSDGRQVPEVTAAVRARM